MSTLGELIVNVRADLSEFERNLNSVHSRMNTLGNTLSGLGARLSAGITAPLVGVGIAAMTTAGRMEQASVAFKTLFGNAEASARMLAKVQEFAAKTPFELEQVLTGTVRLKAFGFAASEILPLLRDIGDAASALGIGAEGLDRLILAFGQIYAKGRLAGEEIRQLAEAGIPIKRWLEEAMGLTGEALDKAIEAGAVSAEQALEILRQGIQKNFGGMMQEQSKTLLGMLSNLKDELFKALADVGKAFMPLAKVVVSITITMLKGLGAIAERFSKLPKPIQYAVAAVGLFAAALGPVLLIGGQVVATLGQLIIAVKLIGGLSAVVRGLAMAFSLVRAAALASWSAICTPAGAVLGVLALIATAIYAVYKAWKWFKSRREKKAKPEEDELGGLETLKEEVAKVQKMSEQGFKPLAKGIPEVAAPAAPAVADFSPLLTSLSQGVALLERQGRLLESINGRAGEVVALLRGASTPKAKVEGAYDIW